MYDLIVSNSNFLMIAKIFAFVVGTFIGSFLNVCICRIPYRKSILYPPSRCFLCLTPIKWYHNIPIVSYFILGGRCNSCHQSFSIRYVVIELMMGLISLSLFINTSDFYSYFVLIYFMGAAIVLSFIDIDHWLLPDRITIPSIFMGILFSIFIFSLPSGSYIDFKSSIAGAFIGFSVLFFLGFVASKILNKEALGGGDIKFMAMIGAFLGWKSFVPILLMAALQGTVFGIFQLIYYKLGNRVVLLNNNGIYSVFKDRSDAFNPTPHHIPFGPFLGLAAYEYIIFGNKLINVIFGLNF